jgi:F-type H+-transporting ATPase subunit a
MLSYTYKDFFNHIPGEIWSSLIIFIIIAIFSIIVGIKASKQDIKKTSKGILFLAEFIYEKIEAFTKKQMGKKLLAFAPYLAFLTIYLVLSFIVVFVKLPSPLTYYGVPLCLSLITFVSIQVVGLKSKGLGGWSKRFIEPMPVFLPINIVTFPSLLLSLSFRLFGNALAGMIVLELVYWATGLLAGIISPINFIGPIIAPFLHAFFDLFGCYIQTLVFILLSSLFIAKETEPIEKKVKRRKIL